MFDIKALFLKNNNLYKCIGKQIPRITYPVYTMLIINKRRYAIARRATNLAPIKITSGIFSRY